MPGRPIGELMPALIVELDRLRDYGARQRPWQGESSTHPTDSSRAGSPDGHPFCLFLRD